VFQPVDDDHIEEAGTVFQQSPQGLGRGRQRIDLTQFGQCFLGPLDIGVSLRVPGHIADLQLGLGNLLQHVVLDWVLGLRMLLGGSQTPGRFGFHDKISLILRLARPRSRRGSEGVLYFSYCCTRGVMRSMNRSRDPWRFAVANSSWLARDSSRR